MNTQDPTTRTVRAGLERDAQHGAIMPPLFLSSNYSFEGLGQPRPYDYTRSGNPTRDLLGEALADLEGGAGAVVTSSGMAAIATVLQLLSPGDVLLAPADGYGGSWRLFDAWAAKGAFEVRYLPPGDGEAWLAAIAEGPALVWLETPSNPLLRVLDIQRLATAARAHGALTVVDNTFLSPVWQQPLGLGADVVVHSTTKYLNGHSDVVGGAVVSATSELHERLAWWANALGVTGAPFDSYLTLRGLRTLPARMPLHDANARAVVDCLQQHPAVARVHHPSLPTHPDHAIARAQQSGYGAVVSFELRGGQRDVAAFVEALRCFSLAESLGGVESLVAHPATMTHAAMSEDARAAAGIGEGLVRLSVGIEATEDLLADLVRGLDAVLRQRRRSDPDGASRPATAVGRTTASPTPPPDGGTAARRR